jgi:hypothetical protein
MNIEPRELTIEPLYHDRPAARTRFGPASEAELRSIAEQAHGGPLDWYKAYRGNLYAEDVGVSYSIRRVTPAGRP